MITIYRDDVTQLAAASRDRTFSNSPEALSSSRRRQNNEARSQMIRNASHDCPKAKRVLRLLCAGQPRRRANQSCFTARPPLFPPASERPTPSSSYPTTINIFSKTEIYSPFGLVPGLGKCLTNRFNTSTWQPILRSNFFSLFKSLGALQVATIMGAVIMALGFIVFVPM